LPDSLRDIEGVKRPTPSMCGGLGVLIAQ